MQKELVSVKKQIDVRQTGNKAIIDELDKAKEVTNALFEELSKLYAKFKTTISAKLIVFLKTCCSAAIKHTARDVPAAAKLLKEMK